MIKTGGVEMSHEEKIEIIEREEVYTLQIAKELTMIQLPSAIGKSYCKIMEYMKSIDVECPDAPFVRYVNLDWDSLNKQNPLKMFFQVFTKKWDTRIGFPVKRKN